MVLKSFLVWVVLKIFFLRSASAIRLNPIESNHIAICGIAESMVFYNKIVE